MYIYFQLLDSLISHGPSKTIPYASKTHLYICYLVLFFVRPRCYLVLGKYIFNYQSICQKYFCSVLNTLNICIYKAKSKPQLMFEFVCMWAPHWPILWKTTTHRSVLIKCTVITFPVQIALVWVVRERVIGYGLRTYVRT